MEHQRIISRERNVQTDTKECVERIPCCIKEKGVIPYGSQKQRACCVCFFPTIMTYIFRGTERYWIRETELVRFDVNRTNTVTLGTSLT